MECIYCATGTHKNNPTFCSTQCQIDWTKEQEEKLAKKLMVRVNSVTWVMLSKHKPNKDLRLWKKWMAAARKLMKVEKGDQAE